jgi:hypothetical protein
MEQAEQESPTRGRWVKGQSGNLLGKSVHGNAEKMFEQIASEIGGVEALDTLDREMLRTGCRMMVRSRRIAARTKDVKLATEIAGEARRYIEAVRDNVRWLARARGAAALVKTSPRALPLDLGEYLARTASSPVDQTNNAEAKDGRGAVEKRVERADGDPGRSLRPTEQITRLRARAGRVAGLLIASERDDGQRRAEGGHSRGAAAGAHRDAQAVFGLAAR